MSVATPFEPLARVFERNINIRHVYAEPVQHGDTTVIPVARVAYGFGGGAGRRPGSAVDAAAHDAEGGGGGGGALLTPVGALEVGPHGTRFIRYNQLPQLAAVFALGVGVGALLTLRRR